MITNYISVKETEPSLRVLTVCHDIRWQFSQNPCYFYDLKYNDLNINAIYIYIYNLL